MLTAIKDIREHLADYLAGNLALDAFEDWFVQNSWNAQQSDPDDRAWVHAVELRLSEFSSGHLSESQLQKELRPFVTTYTGQISFNGVLQARMDSTIKWAGQQGLVLQIAASADTLPAVVFG
jgi:hypothetical protein